MNNERDSYPKSVAYIGEYRDSRPIIHGGFTYLASGSGTQGQKAVNGRPYRDWEGFKWIKNGYRIIKCEAMKMIKSLLEGFEYLITCNRKEHLDAIKQVRESAASLNQTIQYFNEDITDPRALTNKKRRSTDK